MNYVIISENKNKLMSANSKKIWLRNIKVKKVNEKHYFKLLNKQ
jgi:hypothetical protein